MAEKEMARAAIVAIKEESTNARAAAPAEWDVILNDPVTHSSSHPGKKVFGEYIRARCSYFKYYKMDTTSKSELENSIIKNIMEYFRGNGRFLIKQGNLSDGKSMMKNNLSCLQKRELRGKQS